MERSSGHGETDRKLVLITHKWKQNTQVLAIVLKVHRQLPRHCQDTYICFLTRHIKYYKDKTTQKRTESFFDYSDFLIL